MEKLLKVVKPFAAKMTKKKQSQPILSTALVTDEHIIATDSHKLIRIKHHQNKAPYLHHFQQEYSLGLEVGNYPQTDRLIPDPLNAQTSLVLNVEDWKSIHDQALIAAKEHKNYVIRLVREGFEVPVVITENPYDQVSFTHTFDSPIGIGLVKYNCKYMLEAMKALKKLKQQEATLYFYGPHRLMLITATDIEIIILPIR